MTNALITGAGRGIGFAVAGQLGRAGLRVLVGARDAASGGEAVERLRAEDVDADLVEIDVTEVASVRAALAKVGREEGRLDVLVNNAGVLPEAMAGSSGPIDLELFKETFDTNVFGAVAVTEAFLPLLRDAPAGRIVNVSSTMGSLADQADPSSVYYGTVVPAYQASKAALNSITISLSKALAGSTIKVNAVCPGWVKTDLAGPENRAAAPLTAEEGAAIVTRMALIDSGGPTGGFFDRDGRVRW